MRTATFVKLQAVSLPSAPLPKSYEAQTTGLPLVAQDEKDVRQEGPAHTTTTMITIRGSKARRRQETQETTTTGVDTTMVCHRMCDYHHYHSEEEERLTTMVTSTGEKAQGEGCHDDTMTRTTMMITATQDRLQERFERKRTTTSSDYIIRLTDRLRVFGAKMTSCFSHGSRAGTTTRRDMTTTRVAAAVCNGTDYNNCDVSTTATSTTGSDTESTTSADTDLQDTPTSLAVDNSVDLINPLLDNCTHYILMMGAAGKAVPPVPPPALGGGAVAAAAAAPAAAAAIAAPPLPIMLPQARLPQPTVFDGTTPPFQEWIQETRNFLSINNYEFVRQMDYALQSDREVSIQDVTNSTREGGRRRDLLDDNEIGQSDLRRELQTPEDEREDENRTDEALNRQLATLERDHVALQRDYDDWVDRLSRGGDYLNYVLIHGTKLGTEANNYVRRLQRSTNGFEALRLMRLRFSGGQMLQNYQLLRDILNPKFSESQQHFQYRQWLESLSRYELESRHPLDDNLKIATLVNGLRGNLQQHLLLSVKPTSTWQNVREIVENYYSSTFVPNPTTGHIAYLAHGSPEEQLNYVKGRRKGKGKGKGKGGKGKKGGDYHKGKGKNKGKGKTGDHNKGKGKGYNKGGKGYYQGWSSWSQGGYNNNNNNNNNNNKGQGKSKGKGGKAGATTQCHICKKFGHVAANCWYKDSTYTTAAVGSGTTGQTQHFSLDNPTTDQPVALMPRDQLPLYNQHGQCISGTYMQAAPATRAATSSTASYITTPGPVLT